MNRNQVRIIGGVWRRRLLRFTASRDMRPTPDRVRETLFNWLGQTLDGKFCLDLFAGSGALGFEAASRGAAGVVMIERDPKIHKTLMDNARLLNAQNIELRCQDALDFLSVDTRKFDIVFLDPPYRLQLLPRLLALLGGHLARDAQVYLEAEQLPEIPPRYQVSRQARAGQVNYLLIESLGNDDTL